MAKRCCANCSNFNKILGYDEIGYCSHNSGLAGCFMICHWYASKDVRD